MSYVVGDSVVSFRLLRRRQFGQKLGCDVRLWNIPLRRGDCIGNHMLDPPTLLSLRVEEPIRLE